MFRSLIIVCVQIASMTAAHAQTTNWSDQINISDIISNIERAYGKCVCLEGTFCGSVEDFGGRCRLNRTKYDVSKLTLDGIAANLAKDKGITSVSKGCVLLLRSSSYDPKNSPLSRILEPFRIDGRLDDVITHITLANPDLRFMGIGGSQSDMSHRVKLRFDSQTSIENVLLSLADKYRIAWWVRLNTDRSTQPMVNLTWMFFTHNAE